MHFFIMVYLKVIHIKQNKWPLLSFLGSIVLYMGRGPTVLGDDKLPSYMYNCTLYNSLKYAKLSTTRASCGTENIF